MSIFTGAGVAIVTPMTGTGAVNYAKLEELLEFQIANKTDSIIICGTTGEASTLSHEEHLEVIRFTIEKVNKRIPVIAGTGSNCTDTAVYLSQEAEKYGADALRFNLITGNSPGNDMRFYTEKCEAMRNFANKIWNASRFVMMNLSIGKCRLPEEGKLEREDKWVLSKLNTLVKEVTENLDSYEIGVASAKVYDFLWDTYCDWYIELTKTRLQGEDEDSKVRAQQVLCWVLTEMLKLLHPFMPFITEEIWQALPHEGDFLMMQNWPVASETMNFPQEEKAMELIMDAIRAIRGRRSEMNVPPSNESPASPWPPWRRRPSPWACPS